jgi:histidinol phosphatase-like enzyme
MLGPVDYLSKMKIAVMVRQLDFGHILWCGRVVRVERAHLRHQVGMSAERLGRITAVLKRSTKIGDSLIDLSTLNPRKGLIEKSFDLEPRLLQSAIETGSFEITEIFDQSMIKKSSLVVRFSTLELSANIVALELKCA